MRIGDPQSARTWRRVLTPLHIDVSHPPAYRGDDDELLASEISDDTLLEVWIESGTGWQQMLEYVLWPPRRVALQLALIRQHERQRRAAATHGAQMAELEAELVLTREAVRVIKERDGYGEAAREMLRGEDEA